MAVLKTVVFVLAAIVIFRLFDLQVLRHEQYKAQASGRHGFSMELDPERGEIFINSRNASSGKEIPFPAASNIELSLLFADPELVEDPREAAGKLASILSIPEEELFSKMSKEGDRYEPLARRLEKDKAEEIAEQEIAGLGFIPENFRFYPETELFSHILGFVGYSGDRKIGRYGLEERFQDILAGEKGLATGEKDAYGRWIATSQRSIKEAVDGADIYLTIDRNIQFVACRELSSAMGEFEAEGGTIIVMQPKTGRILAMCSKPDFDPNKYSEVDSIDLFVNPAVSHAFEPGSIFKPFTIAAGLDSGVISPDTTYEDTGSAKLAGYTIRNSDFKSHGIQTMTQVLEKSLNTGVIFAMRETGADIFKDYVQKFGFGEPTEAEVTGEAKGDVSSLDKKGEVYPGTASFGHGISVTPLQILRGFSAIANGGKMMKPYLVDSIVYADGTRVATEPQPVGEPIGPQTATTLSAMLVSVVENGFSSAAGADGYYVGGKTGTALVPGKEGGYSEDTIHSFIGFAPVDDPQFSAIVKLDKPKKGRFASYTAAKSFGNIARFVLDYYQIPPEY